MTALEALCPWPTSSPEKKETQKAAWITDSNNIISSLLERGCGARLVTVLSSCCLGEMIPYAQPIAGLLVIWLPTVATGMHNAAGSLKGFLRSQIQEIDKPRHRIICRRSFLWRQHGTISSSPSSSPVHELSCYRSSAGCDLADWAYRPSPGDNRIHHGHSHRRERRSRSRSNSNHHPDLD